LSDTGEARGVYPHRQGGFRDCTAIPHGIEDLVPRDDPIAMPDEEVQQVENLGFYGHEIGPAAQLPPICVERVILERVQHSAALWPAPKFIASPGRQKIKRLLRIN
jgi:hypothetical protein